MLTSIHTRSTLRRKMLSVRLTSFLRRKSKSVLRRPTKNSIPTSSSLLPQEPITLIICEAEAYALQKVVSARKEQQGVENLAIAYTRDSPLETAIEEGLISMLGRRILSTYKEKRHSIKLRRKI